MRETFLPFATPDIGDEEIAEVVDTLRSGWITTGPKTKRFEEAFQEYVGSRHAIAVNSCTAGLHIALTALGVGPGDEVIVPTLTFCSTANVVVHLGAQPVLVDVGEDYNVSPDAIEAAITLKTRAIVPVHYGGQPSDLQRIYAIAARHQLAIVEDAAHAVGATYRGQRIGSDALSRAACTGGDGDRYRRPSSVTVFSFYATKNMTTGEGGMITAADDTLAEQMRLLSLHGMTRDAWKRYTSAGSWYYEVVLPGYKANMTDIQASLGIHQLRRLDSFIAARRNCARLYDQAFADVPEITTPLRRPDRDHVHHLYAIQLQLDRMSIDRVQFIDALKEYRIGASVHFIPVHLHPLYQERFGYRQGDLPVAERIYQGLVSLPLSARMSHDDVRHVVCAVKEIIRSHRPVGVS